MKKGQRGFTFVELLVTVAITAVIGTAATMATNQVCRSTGHSNNRITAVRQVQNAGYWISRDAQMAHSVIAEDLTAPDFLILKWTEWDDDNDPIYHSVTYYFEDITNGIGKLKRSHWSSAGVNEETLVAEYIYYNPDDPLETSKADYLSPELTIELTSVSDETRETREYKITRRPSL